MRGGQGIVLIVDESLSARELVRDLVEDALLGWEVIVARNADEALLNAARSNGVDVALIDRNVVGGGVTLAEEIRSRYPRVHVGLLTSRDASGEPTTPAGVTSIQKPLTETKIRSFVSAVARTA